MRAFLLVVLVISALGYLGNAEDIDTRAGVKDTIDDLINSLKDQIPDPISIPDQTITLVRSDLIFAALSLSNNNIKGLKDFDLDITYQGFLIPLPTKFSLKLSDVKLHLDSISVLELLNSSYLIIQTDGYTNVALTDLEAHGNIDFTLLPLSLSISSLDFSIGGATFDIAGLLTPEISEFLSTALTDLVAPTINSLEPNIASAIQDAINTAIAGALSDSAEKLAKDNVKNYTEEEFAAAALRNSYDLLLNKVQKKN